MLNKKTYTQIEIESLKPQSLFENCVFDKLDIKGKDLQECIFSKCSLENCNLANTKFNGVKFKNCNLSNCHIIGVNFFGASFDNCKLLGLSFSKTNSTLGITFTKCNFDFADLRAIDLSKQDLSNCSFIETDLSLCNLDRTIFVNSRVVNIKIDGTKMNQTDFCGCEIQGFNLKTSNLKGAIFTPQQLEMLANEIGIQIYDT
jgi:fluoroquinolone resistance protein